MARRAGIAALIFLAGAAGGAAGQTRPWVVAGESGVHRVDERGVSVERYTASPAAFAQQLGTHIVFLSPPDDPSARTQVRDLDTRTGRERVVAELGAELYAGCDGIEPLDNLDRIEEHVYFEWDASMDSRYFCLEVMDRNINMADVSIQVEVDRSSGAVRRHIVHASERAGCTPLDESAVAQLPCTALLRQAPFRRHESPWDDERHPYQLDESGAAVVRGSRRFPLAVRRPTRERISPDGRWMLFGGNRAEGDYIHRDVYLLDRARGRIFALDSVLPLPRARWTDEAAMQRAGTSIVGEVFTGWIDNGRALRVGRRVVVPGRSTVLLPGLPVVNRAPAGER